MDATQTEAGLRPEEDEGSSLLQAVASIRRQWKITVGLFLLLALLGGYYVYTLPVQYQASAVVSFQPRKGQVNSQDLVSLLAQRYPEVVASTESVAAAAKASGASQSQVSAGLTAAIQPSTLNMLLSVKLDSPEAALKATNTLYLAALKANQSDPDLQALPVSAPSTSDSPAGTPKSLLYAAVVMLSALVALVSGLIVDEFRNR